jgi:hypothetical protein
MKRSFLGIRGTLAGRMLFKSFGTEELTPRRAKRIPFTNFDISTVSAVGQPNLPLLRCLDRRHHQPLSCRMALSGWPPPSRTFTAEKDIGATAARHYGMRRCLDGIEGWLLRKVMGMEITIFGDLPNAGPVGELKQRRRDPLMLDRDIDNRFKIGRVPHLGLDWNGRRFRGISGRLALPDKLIGVGISIGKVVFTTNCSRWITERSGQSFEELWLRLCHVRYERLEYPLVGQDPPFEIRFFRISQRQTAGAMVSFHSISFPAAVLLYIWVDPARVTAPHQVYDRVVGIARHAVPLLGMGHNSPIVQERFTGSGSSPYQPVRQVRDC